MEGRRRQSGNADVREPENENSENEWRGGERRGEEIQEIEEEKRCRCFDAISSLNLGFRVC